MPMVADCHLSLIIMLMMLDLPTSRNASHVLLQHV